MGRFFTNARYVVRRLRRRLPRAGTLLGIWTQTQAEIDRGNALRETPADIVVTSNDYSSLICPAEQMKTRGVRIFGDANNQWVRTRRIWNQHTYHVTNINEDGTIPDFEPPSWTLLNTYRTNSQIEGGGLCVPPAG